MNLQNKPVFDLSNSSIYNEMHGGQMLLVIPILNNNLLKIPPYIQSDESLNDFRQEQINDFIKQLKIELSSNSLY